MQSAEVKLIFTID